MDKEQKKLLVMAWETHHRLLREIRDLACVNIPLAYGLIRTAETMLDVMMVDWIRKEGKDKVNPS